MAKPYKEKISNTCRTQWAALVAAIRGDSFRQLLWWCLPALILGGIARAWLIIHFPYGYMQADTADFLLTTQRLLQAHHHSLVLHGKKAFLGPILFTLPFLLKIPALLIIPLFQHLLGMITTVMAGALTREWFRHWKVFIIPATILTTLNPAVLWYEHALLAESHYIFCAITLALVGTMLTLKPTNGRLAGLLVALFFTAGSRPEGKLFVLFAILLVALVYWGETRRWAIKMGITVLACGLIWLSSRSSQAGLLLYATVLPLAPETSKVLPDFSPWVAPLRQQYIDQGPTVRTELTTAEKAIYNKVREYYSANGNGSDETGAFCQKLAVEAALNRPFLLPVIAMNKFLMSCKGPTSGGYTKYWVQDKQLAAYTRKVWLYGLTKGLTGKDLKTKQEVQAFIERTSPPLEPDWFSPLQRNWNKLTLHARFPDQRYPAATVQGLSYFFALAFLGMIAAMLWPTPLWRFHVSWIITLLGVWFVVLLTGVVNPRYRFVFEPFCVLYALFVFDAIWSGIEFLCTRGKVAAASQT